MIEGLLGQPSGRSAARRSTARTSSASWAALGFGVLELSRLVLGLRGFRSCVLFWGVGF